MLDPSLFFGSPLARLPESRRGYGSLGAWEVGLGRPGARQPRHPSQIRSFEALVSADRTETMVPSTASTADSFSPQLTEPAMWRLGCAT